jgi:hypothetical protein
MADFVALQAGDLKMHRLVGRIVVAAVAVGNLVGLAGNVAAAVYFEIVIYMLMICNLFGGSEVLKFESQLKNGPLGLGN